MTDLEQQIAAALADGAQDAPSAVGLATGARSRARTRRRNRLAAAAAVVALCVGVPTAFAVTGGSDDGPRRSDGTVATDPAPPTRTLPDGFHYESWHGVTIEVPDSWGYGALDQWCAGDEPERPVVQRPGEASTLAGCGPNAFGYGVWFQALEDNEDDFNWPLTQQDPESWPAGAYVGAHGLGGVLVEIALPDIDLAQQILASARVNAALDPNGCPVDTTSDPVVPADSMTVCRYDAGGLLEQSELLRGDDAVAAAGALEDAPPGSVDCGSGPPSGGFVRLASLADDAVVDLTGCTQLTVHGESRQLTPDVLYWALSPGWSGSVPGAVSLPSELRER
jgi:hypothetical protein